MGQNIKLITMTGEFTRPSNTTAYAANKIVSDSTSAPTTLQLYETKPNGDRLTGLVAGGSYQVKSVELCKSSSGTTNATFDVWIYSSGITAIEDRGAFNPTYANKEIRVGKSAITMATGDTNTDSAEATNTDVDHVFIATQSSIYCRIVATAAYTPVSAEKFYVKIVLFRIDS